jgi:hypothetical protein
VSENLTTTNTSKHQQTMELTMELSQDYHNQRAIQTVRRWIETNDVNQTLRLSGDYLTEIPPLPQCWIDLNQQPKRLLETIQMNI